MLDILSKNFNHAIAITLFVFVMMMIVDYLNVVTRGKMSMMLGGGRFRQYVTASFLGVTPGCLGSFVNVSFYIRGLISIGALAGGMIATSGDEAFVMMAVSPEYAIILFSILFVVGVSSSFVADWLVRAFKISICGGCAMSGIHEEDEIECAGTSFIAKNFRHLTLSRFLMLLLLFGGMVILILGDVGPSDWNWERITFVFVLVIATFIVITVSEHYLQKHIWRHIAKRHLWRIFLWSFGALVVIDFMMQFIDVKSVIGDHMIWVLMVAAAIGMIPESGPHMIFVMLFAKGVIPFSVLVASSIVQDGHGMLPLLSYTLKDSIFIKLFNLIVGLAVGVVMLWLGY